MSYNKQELIQKLELISELWKLSLLITKKKLSFVPDDNYERTVVVPSFPGEYKHEAEREYLLNEFDHTQNNAIEEISDLHEHVYAPQKPEKPKIEEFKAPDATGDEKNKSRRYSCMRIAGIGIAIFFALGFLVTLFDRDLASTLPTIFAISAIGAALYVYSKKQLDKIKAEQKKRADDALVAYNLEKDATIANYDARAKEYEEATEAYKVRLKAFLEEYTTWRKIYLEHVKEEAIIAEKLEQDRLAGVERIDREELSPILEESVLVEVEFENVTGVKLRECLSGAGDYSDAVDSIIDLLKSGRADDLKEALKLYEEMLYREKQLQLQKEQELHRQQEEELRRQDEECRHREDMQFREEQERQRQREESQRQQDAERRHREEMNQRDQQERNRQYAEQQQRAAERRMADKAELARKQQEDTAMRRQCNTCALVANCSMSFRRPNCASYKPR